MTRRVVGLTTVAGMMLLQLVASAAGALWSTYGVPTRVALGVMAAFTWWATTFLVTEAIAAATILKESDESVGSPEPAGRVDPGDGV